MRSGRDSTGKVRAALTPIGREVPLTAGVPEGESHLWSVYPALSSLGCTRGCSARFGCGARYRALLAGIEFAQRVMVVLWSRT
jgi:hypothetical protein